MMLLPLLFACDTEPEDTAEAACAPTSGHICTMFGEAGLAALK